jgi:hypothetical protein
MWALAARMMVLHGAPLAAVNDPVATTRWYQSAVDAADKSGDVTTRVWVRGRSALNMAHPSAALASCAGFAEDALALDHQPSVGRLLALVSSANPHALKGDTTAALTALDDAYRVFDVVGSSGEVSETTMPEWRMAVDTSLILSRLGDGRAAAAQDSAVAALPKQFARHGTHIQLHRALAVTRTGDRRGGVDHARNALSALPIEQHSVALRRLLSEVRTG